MRRIILTIVLLCAPCWAAQYYVSNSTGNDVSGAGTQANPWQTLSGPNNHVNNGSFQPGDTIYLKRGDTWNEQLIAARSGSSGNPITFDAYGVGPAPVITAMAAISGGFNAGSWTHVSGNVWATSNTPGVTTSMNGASTVDMVQFGSIWGRHQPYGSGCASSIVSKYDWCLVYPKLYVYSLSGTNPVSYYLNEGSITPYVDSSSGLPLISVVGQQWLVFQHIKLQGFTYMGVSVSGNSDNLVFANMESDGMLPYGTTPLGFDVNVNSGYGTSIQFVNDDAHLNYDGFRVDAAAGVTITNCRGYANRDAGLKDNSGLNPSPVTYSYSHFYGNNIAQFPAADVVWVAQVPPLPGPIAGPGNISSAAAPAVANFDTYPARFSFTVDDVGSASGTEGYINSFLAPFGPFSLRPGLKFNAAVVPSYVGANNQNAVDWTSVNNWYAAGNEIDSHSWSHQYYTTQLSPGNQTPYPNAPALKIQYTGSGTAATMTVSGTVLSTNVTGAPSDNISGIDLSKAPYNQIGQTGTGGWGLSSYLNGLPHYNVVIDQDTGVPLVRPNTHTVNLAGTTGSTISINGQDIKTAPFVWVYDQTLLLADEMRASQSAIQANVSGLNASFYVYPDGIEDPTTEADAVAAGYTGARGSLAMKGQDNASASANSVYSNGVNAQNITSLAAIQIHGMSQAQVNQMVASLVFRAEAWGVPYGFFTHFNSRGDGTPDISNTELGYLLDAVTAYAGQNAWMTNSALGSAVMSGTNLGGSTRYVQPGGLAVKLAVAQASSPTVGRGVATAYPIDLNGVNRATLGAWDIGASAYLSQRYGTGAGTGTTYVGLTPVPVQMPQTWVNSNEWIGTTTNAISLPSSGTGGAWTCGSTNYGPYTAGSQASLQQAVNDAEACRTASGSGAIITIPAGALLSGNAGITLPQAAGDSSTNFIVLQSSTPLPVGQTACSHGIQDNVAASTQPGIRNLGCNGSAMSYQLGTTVTPVSGAFTLANGTNTNTSAYNDLASMYTIECTGSGCNGIQTASPDANGVGPHHFAILNAEVRPQAGLLGPNAPISIGSSFYTAISNISTHIHIAYSYIHGDWSDAPMSGGVATGSPVGNNSLPNDVAFGSCINCSLTYSYIDKSIRPGAEGHSVSFLLSQTIKLAHNWVEGESISHMCGGWGIAVPIPNFITCQDMEDRGNRYTYPDSWMLAADAGYTPNSSMPATSSGSGTGVILNLMTSQGGAINAVAVQAGGIGNNIGDILTPAQPHGGSNGTVEVTGLSGTAVSSVAVASGAGYSVASGLATTGGHGTGATVNITSVDGSGRILGVSLGSGGSGYTASDNLTVVQTGGSGGLISVTTVGSGGVAQGLFVASGTGYGINGFVRKNAHEYKSANRILVDGNIIENADYTGAQGTTASFKVDNTSSGSGTNYWAEDLNSTITNNIIRNGCNGVSIGYRSAPISGGGISLQAGNYNYTNNLIYNVSQANPACENSPGPYAIRVASGAQGTTWTATVVRDAAGLTSTLTLNGSDSNGTGVGDFAVGDPVLVHGCTDTTFNTGTTWPQTTKGPAALAGTVTNGLTVVYSNPGTPNATDTSGTCTVYNLQGTPAHLFATHNSDFMRLTTAVPGDPGSSASGTSAEPCILASYLTYTNTISVGGGPDSNALGEGTRTSSCAFDPSTLAYNNNAIPGRDTVVTCPGHTTAGAGGIAACYSEYSSGTVTTPPVTLYGTESGYCTGNDPATGNCLGVFGEMGTSSFNYALPDWHLYRLCHAGDAACNGKASPYAAGQAYQASDGADLGVSMAAIDAAQVATKYQCSTPCGTGPYADAP